MILAIDIGNTNIVVGCWEALQTEPDTGDTGYSLYNPSGYIFLQEDKIQTWFPVQFLQLFW